MKTLLTTIRTAAPTSPLQFAEPVAGEPREDAERGDVPGWVLVTMMTAALVVLLWGVAGPALSDLFTAAIAKVQGL